MLDGKGYYKGSTILVSGTAGSGKTTLAANLAGDTCRRGDRCLYIAFEESESQLIRNMKSVGLDLRPYAVEGTLKFHMSRPTLHGLETHLASIHKLINEFNPAVVIVDPISNLMDVSSAAESKSMLTRLIDFLKTRQVTLLATSLTSGGQALERTDVGVSSLVDTWILMRDVEAGSERNRSLYILKSRGMAHSNQLREFLLSKRGIRLIPAYLGPAGVLTGSARVAQEIREKAESRIRGQETQKKKREIELKRLSLVARIEELKAEYEADGRELQTLISEVSERESQDVKDRIEMARSRKADASLVETDSIKPIKKAAVK
jgi:circadian clock protein KaiC